MSALLAAFLFGVVAGSRSMLAPAAVSYAAATGRLDVDGTWAHFLETMVAHLVTVVLALGELVVDKLPFAPSRKAPGPFAGRVLSGAFCGAVVGTAAEGAALGAAVGAFAGAAGAVCGTLGGYAFRVALARRLGRDLPAALVEDGVAIALAVAAVTIVAASR